MYATSDPSFNFASPSDAVIVVVLTFFDCSSELAIVVLTLAMGIRHGFGLFLQPMSADLHWGRETFALALAVLEQIAERDRVEVARPGTDRLAGERVAPA